MSVCDECPVTTVSWMIVDTCHWPAAGSVHIATVYDRDSMLYMFRMRNKSLFCQVNAQPCVWHALLAVSNMCFTVYLSVKLGSYVLGLEDSVGPK